MFQDIPLICRIVWSRCVSEVLGFCGFCRCVWLVPGSVLKLNSSNIGCPKLDMHWDLNEFPSNPVLHPLFLVGRTWFPPPNSPDFRRWIVSIRIWGANVSVKLCWSLAWASVSIPTIKIHWEPSLERATFLEISPKNPNCGWMMMFLFRG